MAHLVETMFSTQKTPWHGLGQILDKAPSVEQAIKDAGLDWKVKLYDLQTVDGNHPVTHKAVVRETDKSILGVVGSKWRPLQNDKAFQWFQPFVDAGEATLDTAGSLKGGRKVWVLAKLDKKPFQVAKGDSIDKYLLLSNGHDGITSIRVGFTPIRVVCNNTLTWAINSENSSLIRLKHTSKANENLELLRDAVNMVDARFEASGELYRKLASRAINRGDLEKYVHQVFFPQIVDLKEATERQASALAEMNQTIHRLFESGRGNDQEGVRGTYWALYNAANEYLNYEAGKSQDTRVDNLWFGSGARQDKRAFEAAVVMAK
jgi:phage/plasmid-like protein (TIGR03299 family)